MSVEIKGLKELEEKLANIKENLKFFDTHTIGIGIPQEQNSKAKVRKEKGSNELVDSNIDLATLAMIHEHGTATIPERSFLRAAIRENKDKYDQLMQDAMDNLDRKGVVELTMNQIAQVAKGDSQLIIGNKSKLAPLKDSTIERKGSSGPLLDTNHLRGSIRGVVQKK